MMKRLLAWGVMTAAAGSAPAATYIVLPSPGSMTPATIVIDAAKTGQDRVFICTTIGEIPAGTCRPHRKSARR